VWVWVWLVTAVNGSISQDVWGGVYDEDLLCSCVCGGVCIIESYLYYVIGIAITSLFSCLYLLTQKKAVGGQANAFE